MQNGEFAWKIPNTNFGLLKFASIHFLPVFEAFPVNDKSVRCFSMGNYSTLITESENDDMPCGLWRKWFHNLLRRLCLQLNNYRHRNGLYCFLAPWQGYFNHNYYFEKMPNLVKVMMGSLTVCVLDDIFTLKMMYKYSHVVMEYSLLISIWNLWMIHMCDEYVDHNNFVEEVWKVPKLVNSRDLCFIAKFCWGLYLPC